MKLGASGMPYPRVVSRENPLSKPFSACFGLVNIGPINSPLLILLVSAASAGVLKGCLKILNAKMKLQSTV